jgi:hypothetical protein
MQLIVKKIADTDEDIHNNAKLLLKSVSIKEVDTKYIKTKTTEL